MSTFTTMVLSIFVETTSPTLVARCVFFLVFSAMTISFLPSWPSGPGSSWLSSRPRQLERSEAHGLDRGFARHAFHLEQDPARTHHTDPMVRRALAAAHTDFSGLLGDGFVREQAQPHLAAALDETRHRDTAGFDLAV